MTDQIDIPLLKQQTVQDLQDATRNNGLSTWGFVTNNGPLLAPWGTRERERQLRLYYRYEYGTLLQGAFMGLIKKVKSTPWTIEGGRNLANQFQRIFRNAQFGYGWGDFLSRVLLDYLRFDGGAYIELIAPGDPLKPPTSAITGMAHLDSYNCYPTGDPEFPVLYWSRFGKLHLMHRTRIAHLVDMPDGDQFNPGYGLCALSRAIAVVEREMLMSRYISSNLDDKPSPGVVIAHNFDKGQRDAAFAALRQEQNRDAQPQWGNVVWLYGMNPTIKPELENFTFMRPPEKFDWQTYVNIDVDMLALAIGVDRQDLWPLSTRAMGSGAQSEILAEKAKGKAFGDILITLERLLNDVLPESLEFSFKTSDPTQQAQDAQTALVWANFIVNAGAHLSNDEGRRLLAQNVNAVLDVVTDESGNIVDLPDVDVVPIKSDQIAPNTDPAAQPVTVQQAAAAAPDTTATDSTPNAPQTAKKGLETDEQRRWFFAHIGEPDTGKPLVMDFEEYASRNGASRQDTMMDSALHRSSSNVSGSARASQLRIENERNTAALAKRDVLRGEYNQHVASGYIRPPTHDEALILTAQGQEDNRSVQAARRLLEKRGIDWTAKKDIEDTEASFTADFSDLLSSACEGSTTRRRFGIILRDLIRKYGKSAYSDGLKDGGVADGVLDNDDQADYTTLLAEQSAYVTGLGSAVYQAGISDTQAADKADLWFNKSITPFYQHGLASADANGVYEWVLGATKEHCVTCATMAGQTHRLKDYQRKDILPQGDTLECKGFNCACRLQKTNDVASGMWLG